MLLKNRQSSCVRILKTTFGHKMSVSKFKFFSAECEFQWRERLFNSTRKSWEGSKSADTSWVKDEQHSQAELQPPCFQASLVSSCREASFTTLTFALLSCFQLFCPDVRRKDFFPQVHWKVVDKTRKAKTVRRKKNNLKKNPGSKQRLGGNFWSQSWLGGDLEQQAYQQAARIP